VIHIDRSHLPSPGVVESEEFKKLIETLLSKKSEHNLKRHYIRQLSKGLKGLYNKKCGYCETKFKTESSLSMDHYRPKGKLIGEDHPGYYWLCYEWTNLVPVCSGCNNAKSTKFPLVPSKGKRVTEPPMDNGCLDMEACLVDSGIHIAEEPLLLNPEVDRPEEHLVFLPTGEINGTSLKGENSIKICQLDRDELIGARKGVIDKLFKAVIIPLRQFFKEEINKKNLLSDLNKELSKMKEAQNPQKNYSRLGWFLFEEFERFFIQPLRKKGKNESVKILEEAFSNFQQYGTCRKPKAQP